MLTKETKVARAGDDGLEANLNSADNRGNQRRNTGCGGLAFFDSDNAVEEVRASAEVAPVGSRRQFGSDSVYSRVSSLVVSICKFIR